MCSTGTAYQHINEHDSPHTDPVCCVSSTTHHSSPRSAPYFVLSSIRITTMSSAITTHGVSALILSLVLLLLLVPSSSASPTHTLHRRDTNVSTVALSQALHNAASQSQRLAILLPDASDPSNITYTFHNNSVIEPTGGSIVLSAIDQFPALAVTNVAMAIGFVNPCGLNTPHTHHRANEYLTVIQGVLYAGLIVEGNPGGSGFVQGKAAPPTGPLTQVNVTLNKYQGMIFPQGEVYWQFNPTCEPAVFAAAFDNNDPGRVEVARTFFSIRPDDVLETSMGNPEQLDAAQIDSFKNKIPSAFAKTMEECARRCHLI